VEALAGNLSSKPGVVSYKDARISNQHQHAMNLNVSKSSRIINIIIQKRAAANEVAEFPATEKKMGSVEVISSSGNPAYDAFITVTKKHRGDIRAATSSKNSKTGSKI